MAKNEQREILKALLEQPKRRGFYLQRFFLGSYYIEIAIFAKTARSVTVTFEGPRGKVAESFSLENLKIVGEDELHVGGNRFVFAKNALLGRTRDGQTYWKLHLTPAGGEDAVMGKASFRWAVNGEGGVYGGNVSTEKENLEYMPYYHDTLWGEDLPQKLFFLHGGDLKSNISQRPLGKDFFLVQGGIGNKLALTVKLGGEKVYCLSKGLFNCTTVGKEVHWTVSIKHKGTIYDIDVSCTAEAMSIRSYDSPITDKRLRVASGIAQGEVEDRAELRVLRPVAKTLELIEFAVSRRTFAEYGEKE